MTNFCQSCNKLLEEGDVVTTRIVSVYHVLKSQIAYALDKHDMQVLEPLVHQNCNFPNGMPEN